METVAYDATIVVVDVMVLANIGVGVVELMPAAWTNDNHRRSRPMRSTVTEQSSLIDTEIYNNCQVMPQNYPITLIKMCKFWKLKNV
jgi:hypothetical protein